MHHVREGEAVVEVTGAVTLMSVHASKGLEFPVVVLANASWARGRHDSSLVVFDPDVGAACKLPVDDPDAQDPDPFAYAYAATLAKRRERAERKRLLYVGATRAQDYLIVSGSLQRCPAHAWLRQWLDALDVTSDDLIPGDDPQRLDYDWGVCELYVPQTVIEPDTRTAQSTRAVSGWDAPAVLAGEPFPGVTPDLPPLLDPVPVRRDAPARDLAASHIAALGRAPFYDPPDDGFRRVRHAVLHDAPDPVHPLPDRVADHWQLRRYVGSVVHRALQLWTLPGTLSDNDLRDRLTTYAWAEGLSDQAQIDEVVGRSLWQLQRFARHDLRAQLEAADQVLREFPFMLRYGGRTLHGVIDVLFRDGAGWHVLDYKTALVNPAGAEDNARRYYLQVGVYARAVEQQTGVTPSAALYYVFPGHLVTVPPSVWEPALDRLEDDLHAALEG
ncbi:MAG: PD-(D/E)XK nuclease family protein [Anaerolineae bacterium]|nr:PD-(D/E)XK nuclease family protein [Anaerolineae bacterium]